MSIYITGKYKHYFHVLNVENNSVKDIDWQTIKEWRPFSRPEDAFEHSP